jgi:hypothetical protein
MTDPRNDRVEPQLNKPRAGFREDDVAANSRTGTSMWAWIAGLVAAIFLVAIIYGFANRDTETAGGGSVPPATSGSTATTGAGGTTTGSGGTTGGGSAPSSTGQGGGTGAGPSGSGGATTSGSGTTAPGQPGQGAR